MPFFFDIIIVADVTATFMRNHLKTKYICFMTHKLLQTNKKHVNHQALNTIKDLDYVNKNLPQCSILAFCIKMLDHLALQPILVYLY